MGKFEVQFLSLLLFILFLHCTGIYYFTGGFLLTRTELSATSTCDDVDASSGCILDPVRSTAEFLHRQATDGLAEEAQNSPCSNSSRGSQRTENAPQCWTKPLVTRVVVLVIDALRFDFVAPSNSTDEHVPWFNQLKIVQQLAGTAGVPAKLFKFIADPPTTTLQRLKGLTTGGLPTFMDIGHSFGAPAIVEDNLLSQLVHMKKRVVMMGDDTWMQLFPTHFEEAYPFPSFNVKDLHTVDDGVIKEIIPALRRKNWDLLIGHLLGVDHVGHIFGVDSPLMVDKLRQYNQLITDILNVLMEESQPGCIHDNTLFIVMGDHGQTLNGDHGGGTAEEVETALFAITTKNFTKWKSANFSSHTLPPQSTNVLDFITIFPQLDFASTMAAIMGTPIPFGSVGQVNPTLWALSAGVDISSLQERVDHVFLEYLNTYSQTLCINSWQVERYLQMYTTCARTGFPKQELLNLQKLYAASRAVSAEDGSSLRLAERNTVGDRQAFYNATKQQIQTYTSFLSAAASLARAQWTQFRSGWMGLGLGVLFVALGVQSVAVYRVTVVHENKCHAMDSCRLFPANQYVLGSLMFVSVLVAVVSSVLALLWNFSIIGPEHLDAQFCAMFPGLVAFAAGIAYMLPTMAFKPDTKLGMAEKWTVSSICSISFVLLHTSSLFSNSYIIGEGSVVNFLVASVGVLHFRQRLKAQENVFKAWFFLLVNFALVGISLLGLSKDPATTQSTSSFYAIRKHFGIGLVWTSGLAILPLLGLHFVIRRQIATQQPCLMSTSLVLKVAVPATYWFLVLHWLTYDASVWLSHVESGDNQFPTATSSKALAELARLQLPRMVYMTSLLITVITVLSLLFLHKGPVGWQSVVNEALISLLAGWSGTIMLLVGKKGPAILLLSVLEVWCMREMVRPKFAVIRSSGVRASAMADWNLLALQLFFCTGHRCTFDGLNYTAAFIGFDDFNFYRQGVLLALNTFGISHVLPVLALPLLMPMEDSKQNVQADAIFALKVSQLYLAYGLVRGVTTTASVVSAALQRRHLMVWGLFAPKYVFDAVGLIVTDLSVAFSISVILCSKRTISSYKPSKQQ